ncbi:hypothetical protein FHX08_002531 [Rhizobium sp. BK529]|uniref:hypothetical protein n=1 Tax=unclassified Rhizobium TaxID=2613769 RepID=UPI00104B29CA|nr:MULTISPECIES: hypothetical protein [unclassified Rhizobium]MBB3592187.1 hypothetical protein [Rhizobium sp. BK529]TCS06608.1 hypothetical protein EV281_102213 [Rhizobium sp. BK418]
MPNKDSIPAPDQIPDAESQPGQQPPAGIPDRIQENPQDPGDTKKPEDRPLDPALLPIGDPAGAA